MVSILNFLFTAEAQRAQRKTKVWWASPKKRIIDVVPMLFV